MIQRRWPDTILCAIGSLALLGWAVHLFHGSAFWGLVVSVLGLAVGVLAVMGPASGPCPACGKQLHGLFALTIGDYERCPHCRAYFDVKARAEVSADTVAPAPTFSIPVDQGERLPSLCCVCAAPAERVQEVVHRTEGRVSNASPTVLKTELKVAVPYCAKHEGGVSIWNEDLAPSVPLTQGGQQNTDHRWVLKVRSYKFYRAAVLN